MSLGNHLFEARKKRGLSQEEVAGKLGVSRQTISKWETDETLPDICQSKKLAVLYGLSLDELVEFDIGIKAVIAVRCPAGTLVNAFFLRIDAYFYRHRPAGGSDKPQIDFHFVVIGCKI